MIEPETPKPFQTLEIRGHQIQVISQTGSIRPTCAVLSPEGTFSHSAFIDLLGNQVNIHWSADNQQVVDAVKFADTDLAIAATENSVAGFVNETTYSIIASDNSLVILGEIIVPVNQTLFGTSESFARGIVRSHPKAFEQCRKWLSQHPDLEQHPDSSTAEAVKIAALSGELAIGPRICGDLYNAPVLEEAIQDAKNNKTRFWLLGQGETEPTGNDRTTLYFNLSDRPGTTVAVLNPFANRGINVKLISLIHGDIDQYKYLLQIDGHAKDKPVREALSEIRTLLIYENEGFRTLGSYQRGELAT